MPSEEEKKTVQLMHDLLNLCHERTEGPRMAVWALLGVAAAMTMNGSDAGKTHFLNMCGERWDDMAQANIQPVPSEKP